MWGPLLFAIGSAALGLYLWYLTWRYLQLRRAMRSWPQVPALVLGYRTTLSRSSRRIDVKLRYQYDGRVITMWSRSPTRSAFGRGDLQAEKQVAARYPRGRSRQVFVNPATPEEAFLELPEAHMLAMLVGGGMILVALAFAVALPNVYDVDQELVVLGFMLVLAAALTVVAGFAAFALWRLPRP